MSHIQTLTRHLPVCKHFFRSHTPLKPQNLSHPVNCATWGNGLFGEGGRGFEELTAEISDAYQSSMLIVSRGASRNKGVHNVPSRLNVVQKRMYLTNGPTREQVPYFERGFVVSFNRGEEFSNIPIPSSHLTVSNPLEHWLGGQAGCLGKSALTPS